MEESPQQGNQKITLLSLGKGHIISISQGTFHLFYLFIYLYTQWIVGWMDCHM